MSVVVAELQPRETGFTLRLKPAVELTDQQFFDLWRSGNRTSRR